MLHGPLGDPATLDAVRKRGSLLLSRHVDYFTTATPHQTVAALFTGWTLVGSRPADESDHWADFVLHRNGCWIGLSFPAAPDLTTTGAHSDWRLAARRDALWPPLTGAQRLRLVLAAVRGQRGNRVTGQSISDFLDAVARDCYASMLPLDLWDAPDAWKRSGVATIVLTAPIPDPDGQVAAARTLAALGAFDRPRPR